jgi:hypothetical protein
MPPKLKPVLYGIVVFLIYALLTWILRMLTGRMPENPEFLGIYTTNDLLLGLVVAVVLTISNQKKKKLK